MRSAEEQPSAGLLAGRRGLEGLARAKLLGDLQWDEPTARWLLPIEIEAAPETNTTGFPLHTTWIVLIDPSYPWGGIDVFPARDGGIKSTYHHQQHDGDDDGIRPYRSGSICVHAPIHPLQRHAYDPEPITAHERLRWVVGRAIAWVDAAAANELVRTGEPFELPALPVSDTAFGPVAFIESARGLQAWEGVTELCGTVELASLPGAGAVAVHAFADQSGKELVRYDWGLAAEAGDGLSKGVWLRVNNVPTIVPWKAPTTWGELRQACSTAGLELDRVMRPLARLVRDNRLHLGLIGFPIPAKVGAKASQYHWLAIKLPILKSRAAKGFRAGEGGKWRRDRATVFAAGARVHWLRSENWDQTQFASRGRLATDLCCQRVLLIGAGALGSMVAELLVRGGVRDLTVLDPDSLFGGNLVRHTLSLSDVGKAKATALAEHLNSASPHARVRGFRLRFPQLDEASRALATASSLVIDCTADDRVAHLDLGHFEWGPQERIFMSISCGLEARRLFFFTHKGPTFPSGEFRAAVGPWLARESEEWAGRELPREGIGCWSPIFPARVDDLWMLAATALKRIERATTQKERTTLTVYERTEDGVRLAAPPPSAETQSSDQVTLGSDSSSSSQQ